AIAAADLEGCLPVIDEHDLDLAAIVGVDGARTIEYGHRMLGGKPGPGPDLGLETLGQRDGKAGRDHGGGAGRDRHHLVGAERGGEVHSRRAGSLLSGDGQSPPVLEPAKRYAEPGHHQLTLTVA